MASNELIVKVVGDASALRKSFRQAEADTSKFTRTVSQSGRGALAASGAFRHLGRSIAFASASFLGTAGLVSALKASVDAASNLSEQTNKVNVVFGDSAQTITDWAKTTATSIGIANDQALEAAGTFGNLFTTVGLAADKNADMSKSLVQLAADMASFNNADPSDVLLALRSGLVGEAEPLRRFGVLLSETRVQQEAMRETGKKSATQLTAQEKVLARYNLILKDTKLAQGDFARTQDGLANASRQLHAEIRDTEAVIGKALLPSVQKITLAIRDWLGDAKNQKRIQRDVTEAVREGTEVAKGMVEALKIFKTLLKPIVDGLGGARNAAIVASLAFVLLKTRALLAAAGVRSLRTALMRLPTRIGISVLVGFEAVGPLKKLFGQFGADFSGTRTGAGADMFGSRAQRQALARARALRRAGNSDRAIRAQLAREMFGSEDISYALNAITRTGEDVRLRGAAAGAFTPRGGGTAPGPLGFNARMARLDLALSYAELTATQRDNRAILVQQAALIRQRRTKVKSVKDLTALNQQLAQVQTQIAAIDKDAADKEQAARDKQLAAKKAQQAKFDAMVKKANEQVREYARRAREQAAAQKQAMKDASQAALSQIGSLFGGPILSGDTAGILGIRTPRPLGGRPGIGMLTADVKAQTAQGVRFNNDLTRLINRGAPTALISTLIGQGEAGAGFAHTLATGKKSDLNRFFQAYGERQNVAQQIARADIQAKHVTIVTGHVGQRATTPSSQRRGPSGGVPNSLYQNVHPGGP